MATEISSNLIINFRQVFSSIHLINEINKALLLSYGDARVLCNILCFINVPFLQQTFVIFRNYTVRLSRFSTCVCFLSSHFLISIHLGARNFTFQAQTNPLVRLYY